MSQTAEGATPRTHTKRVCIAGTAPSWRRTPWHDPSIEIWALNDCYMLGFPRIDRHYELHPLDQMWFRPRDNARVLETDIPKGFYVRPEGHLDTLKEMAKTIPVFLQQEPPDDWPPHARRFPIEAVTQAFGDDYWASGPSYMIAQAVLEGYTEIWVTGIHLSTEHEYREQRPQWEHLLGRMLGPHVRQSAQDGWRIFDGAIRLVLPKESPILQHGWKYAYEPKPEPVLSAYDQEWRRTTKERNALIESLVRWPADQDKAKAMARLERLDIILLDIRQQQEKDALAGGTLTITPITAGV